MVVSILIVALLLQLAAVVLALRLAAGIALIRGVFEARRAGACPRQSAWAFSCNRLRAIPRSA